MLDFSKEESGLKVLIIDDDKDFSETLIDNFKDHNISAHTVSCISELESYTEDVTHAVVDLRLGIESGLDCIPILRQKYPEAFVVLLTAYGSIRTSVEAIKKGADEYLLKPCKFNELLTVLLSEGGEVKSSNDSQMMDLYQKEKEYIDYVMLQNNGNISKSAEVLGIRRQSLQRKLKKYSEKKIE